MSSKVNSELISGGHPPPGTGGAPPTRSRQQRRVGGAASPAKEDGDMLLAALERAVLDIIGDEKATPGERNAAIGNGVKLLAIRHRIHGSRDAEDYFG